MYAPGASSEVESARGAGRVVYRRDGVRGVAAAAERSPRALARARGGPVLRRRRARAARGRWPHGTHRGAALRRRRHLVERLSRGGRGRRTRAGHCRPERRARGRVLLRLRHARAPLARLVRPLLLLWALLERGEPAMGLCPQLAELAQQRLDVDLVLEVDLEVGLCLCAILQRLAVLAHHDQRTLETDEHREREVEQ